MSEQWPRYEVFKQDRDGGPIRNVGSVHAPDDELALGNARDVFARRPACVALWVIPADLILSQTAEQLANDLPEPGDGPGQKRSFAVFSKESHRQTMTYVDYIGTVQAHSAMEAIGLGHKAEKIEGIVWWACPEESIRRSAPEEREEFAAATSKLFRMPNQYHTVFTMQQIRRAEEGVE
jgi:ring-1,2-phenylacetyl-CoA epoxidase subunit PaaB